MKLENNWRFKTLENLEKDADPEVRVNSHLVIKTSLLRKIPLNEFSVEDLRIMIGQNFGLPYLISLTIEKLTEDVLAEGDLYPGDLLVAVTKIDTRFWIGNPKCKEQIEAIIAANLSVINTMDLN